MAQEIAKFTAWSWEATAAVFCFVAGIAAGILGSGLTALAWIVGGPLNHWVHAVGTALLVVTIPLLILAGYCMDWMECKLNTTRQKAFSLPPVVMSKEERTLGRLNKASTGRKSHEDRPGNTRTAK